MGCRKTLVWRLILRRISWVFSTRLHHFKRTIRWFCSHFNWLLMSTCYEAARVCGDRTLNYSSSDSIKVTDSHCSPCDLCTVYISTKPDETSKLSKLTECVKNIKDWMTSNFLLLNSDKTEILLVGPKNSTQNLLDYNLQLDGCTVTSSTVKNLGVILDSNLSFENHISNVTKTAFFHLRNISKLRNMLSVSDAEKLVHAFMTSRLDYCNALLGGCPASSINKLQIVQNAVARVLTRSRKYDHITPILQSLHWLPIKFRISYKILLLAYKALNDLAPAYLTNLLSRYNPTRSLRSQNSGLLVVPRIAKSTKGGRTFSYLAPKLWNSLPENVWGSDTLSLFKSRLKTHLFSQAFI